MSASTTSMFRLSLAQRKALASAAESAPADEHRARFAELTMRLRVAERELTCKTFDPIALAMIRRTLRRDCGVMV